MGLQPHWQTLITLLISALGILIIFFNAITFYKKYRQADPVQRFYLKFIARLNHKGMSLKRSDGPYQIKQQAIIKFPQSASSIKFIIDHYIMIRYAGKRDKQMIREFTSAVKQFKLT